MDNSSNTNCDDLDTPLISELNKSNTENLTDEQNVNQWQRISPIAMVYFTIKFIYAIFSNIIYIAPAIVVSYKQILAYILIKKIVRDNIKS